MSIDLEKYENKIQRLKKKAGVKEILEKCQSEISGATVNWSKLGTNEYVRSRFIKAELYRKKGFIIDAASAIDNACQELRRWYAQHDRPEDSPDYKKIQKLTETVLKKAERYVTKLVDKKEVSSTECYWADELVESIKLLRPRGTKQESDKEKK